MGRLNQIEQVINSTVNHYSNIKVMPRGVPDYLDRLLRGTIRFAKRTGSNISMINPQNVYPIVEEASRLKNELVLGSTSWIVNGSLMAIGPNEETVEVEDIVDNKLILVSPLKNSYSTNQKALLHSVPVRNSVAVQVGDTELTIATPHKLANGDVIAYLSSKGLIDSVTESVAHRVVFLGTTPDPDSPMLYKAYLNKPLSANIDTGAVIYLRAYPAYFSPLLPIPNQLMSNEPYGPFLIDHLSGRLLEGKKYDEYLSIRTLNDTDSYIDGNESEYTPINKNHLVFSRPMSAHVPMFWDVAEGTTKMTPNRVVLRTNDKGLFLSGLQCVPPIEVPETKWKVSLLSTLDCSIRWVCGSVVQEFLLLSGLTKNVELVIPSEKIERLEFNAVCDSGVTDISLSSWTLQGPKVNLVDYSLVVHATGIATYQSTGIIIKPYFLDSNLLGARYNNESRFNSGKIFM